MKRLLFGALLASTLTSGCKTETSTSGLREDEPDEPVAADGDDDFWAEEARKVLLVTGKGTGSSGSRNRCAGDCHGVDADTIKKWSTKAAELDKCFETAAAEIPSTDPDKKKKRAQAQINCMKASPTATTYATGKVGFYRASVHLPSFEKMFKDALGDGYEAEYMKFTKKLSMPPEPVTEGAGVTPEEFDVLQSWWPTALSNDFRGLAAAFALEVVEATTCSESISDAMTQHVKALGEEGWRAKNKALGLPMFACDGARCFEQIGPDHKPVYPPAEDTTFGKGWTPSGAKFKLRHLRTLAGSSSYWMRSSADGRFVGNGGATVDGDQGGSVIEDLLLKDRPRITVAASYDPGFFPDNKGWTFHGAEGESEEGENESQGGAIFCSQRLIEDPAVKHVKPKKETRWCSSSKLEVYQHVGASLDGSGYYVLRSDNYTNDNGGYDARQDPSVVSFATAFAKVEIWPMHAAADTFKIDEQPIIVKVPFEGDWSISPSATLAAARIAGGSRQQGYRVRKIEGEAPNLKLTDMATVCMPGGKATFAYDERFMAVHHYVTKDDWQELGFQSADDEAFKKLVGNASNVYVYDFVKKKKTRVTNVKPGQFALYPHFRADNWMYFLVRNPSQNDAASKDYVMASDVALVEAAAP